MCFAISPIKSLVFFRVKILFYHSRHLLFVLIILPQANNSAHMVTLVLSTNNAMPSSIILCSSQVQT